MMGEKQVFNKQKTNDFKDLEREVLSELKDIIENSATTNFEKEKVSIAVDLIEKGVSLSNVLRRLQITFVGKTQSPALKYLIKKYLIISEKVKSSALLLWALQLPYRLNLNI